MTAWLHQFFVVLVQMPQGEGFVPTVRVCRMMAVMKSWYVYILRCADGTLYTGISNDLQRRLAAHARGSASKYTRVRLPVTLVYSEEVADRSRATRREAEIKKMSRRSKIALISRSEGH